MRRIVNVKTLILAITGMTAWGLGAPHLFAAKPEATAPRGLVVVVGGVGGIDIVGCAAQWALPRAGIPHEVVDFYWTHGWGQVFKDLQDTQHCLRKADELACYLSCRKFFEPDLPIYLVGKSGGAGLVLAAAEQLPPATLERIILLSPAVSPSYDLRPALCATKRELVSFYSPFDRLVLGWGTSHFGTEDRYYGPSAGLWGFRVPSQLPAADRPLYDRLVQLPWRPGMIKEGYLGGHFGTSFPSFVAKEVAPWLK
jgi:hypothetical protein